MHAVSSEIRKKNTTALYWNNVKFLNVNLVVHVATITFYMVNNHPWQVSSAVVQCNWGLGERG